MQKKGQEFEMREERGGMEEWRDVEREHFSTGEGEPAAEIPTFGGYPAPYVPPFPGMHDTVYPQVYQIPWTYLQPFSSAETQMGVQRGNEDMLQYRQLPLPLPLPVPVPVPRPPYLPHPYYGHPYGHPFGHPFGPHYGPPFGAPFGPHYGPPFFGPPFPFWF